MATTDKRLNIAPKRIMGWQSFKDNMFDFLRDDIHNLMGKVYRTSGAFVAMDLAAGTGNDQFDIQASGGGTVPDGLLAIDGGGYLLAPKSVLPSIEDVPFENTVGNDYHVAMRMAEKPSGLYVNPRDGMPTFDTFEEIIGWSASPDSVVDNTGTLTFIVNSVTESGVSHVGRKVIVYKTTPGVDAQTEIVAIEECTTVWNGGNNEITTSSNFGQGATPSTTASDYLVILVGPRVSRTTNLKTLDPWMFLGVIAGNGPGSSPVAFDMAEQQLIDIPLSDLSDIIRYEGASGTDRAKIDVTVFSGDAATDQIRVTDLSNGTPIRFKVDGLGNVTVEGDLTVQGDTFQKDITQVDTHLAVFDNMNLGNEDTDDHLIKGNWIHKNAAETAVFFQVGSEGSIAGHIGVGMAPIASSVMAIGGLSTFYNTMTPNTDNTVDIGSPSLRWKEIFVADTLSLENDAILRFKSDFSDPDEKIWRFRAIESRFDLKVWNDVESTSATVLRINRTGAAADWMAIKGNISLGSILAPTEFVVEAHGHTGPASASYDLGSVTTAWNSVYAADLVLSGGASMVNLAVNGAGEGEGVSTDLIPQGNQTKSLGTPSWQWADLHVSRVVTSQLEIPGYGVKCNLIPSTPNDYNLGANDGYWSNVHGDDFYIGEIHPLSGDNVSLNAGLIPTFTDDVAIGDATHALADLYSMEVYTDGIVQFGTSGVQLTGHLYPLSNGGYDLGTVAKSFGRLVLDGLILDADDSIGTTAYTTITAVIETGALGALLHLAVSDSTRRAI
jgi:hypothetical protein